MKFTYTREELNKEMIRVLNGKYSTAIVRIRFTAPVVGGQPANDKGIEAFVHHYLNKPHPKTGVRPMTKAQEIEAVARIKKEEIKEAKDVTPAEGELKEEKTYGLNCLRRNDLGQAYIGTWQFRAMLKQTGSRLGLFQAAGKKGSKGDMSEGMLVLPHGASLIGHEQLLGLLNPTARCTTSTSTTSSWAQSAAPTVGSPSCMTHRSLRQAPSLNAPSIGPAPGLSPRTWPRSSAWACASGSARCGPWSTDGLKWCLS